MLKRLQLKNYKCFETLDLALPPLCALIGPNNAGKSSILEALMDLSASIRAPPAEVFSGPRDLKTLVFEKAADKTLSISFFIPGPSDETYFEARLDAPSRNPTDHDVVPSKEILQFLREIAYVSFDAKKMASPCPIEVGEGGTFRSEGYGLPAVLDFRKGEQLERFLSIQSAMQEAFPDVGEIVIRKRVERKPAVTTLAQLFFRLKSGFELPAQLASAGMLLYLGYLSLLFSESPPSMILVEEPENGNHPRRLEQIVQVLRKIATGAGGARPTQVIMTTHSPYILDFLKPEEVFIVYREPGEAATVTRLADAPHLRERLEDFSVGELVFNVGERSLVKGAE